MKITKKILKRMILEALQEQVVEMPPSYLQAREVPEPAPREESLEDKLERLREERPEDYELVMDILMSLG
jgi:hypothetical protein